MVPTMKTLWDLSAWLWVDISQLALVFWQVKTATKLTTNDLKQFINAWVPLLDQLSSQLKVSKWEISDMITKWQISFEMVEQALTDMTSAWWRFENLMEKQSWTFQWMLSNIHDSFDWIKESLGMAILPLLEKLGIISPIIENIRLGTRTPKVISHNYGCSFGLITPSLSSLKYVCNHANSKLCNISFNWSNMNSYVSYLSFSNSMGYKLLMNKR